MVAAALLYVGAAITHMTGAFITFEGGEGSGKSTQLALLKTALERANIAHINTREPGGTPSAERIRALLVSGEADAWHPISETLLFYAARTEHVQRLIKPALAEGKLVVCDRFADSTRVYQGVGKQVDGAFIDELHRLSLGSFAPYLTFILDIEPAKGLARAKSRQDTENRFEEMELSFHQRIREGFLAIAKAEPERCVVLDATQDPQTLHQGIVRHLQQKLQLAI